MDKNRKTAFLALRDIETKEAYSNLTLNHYIGEEKPDSPAFVRELTYGVLERRMYLDYIVKALLVNPKSRLKAADRTVLRMGLYQILYMDSVPDYAAVNESVQLAKVFCKGRDGFINGMLRGALKRGKEIPLPDEEADPVRFLSVKYSYAEWIVELWLAQYGREKAEQILAAGNERPELSIRVNSLKRSAEELTGQLKERGYEVLPGRSVKEALRVCGSGLLSEGLYEEGYFSVQDESSMTAVEVLDPRPGEVIVDVCAAPGGKSLFCAERMKNRGKIYSWDVYEAKLPLIEREAERLGISIVETEAHDGETTDQGLFEAADRVLVDAPCSGLGVLRRKPEIKYREKEAGPVRLPEKQLRILSASSEYVKPGGVLVYSTCTINRQENEEVVERFLEEHRDRGFFPEEETQILPGEGMDGFFISRMKRK